MNILLLGSGGREHAMAWKIKQSPLCKNLYIAPGNAGTQLCGKNVKLSINNFDAITTFIDSSAIDMVVVGPEEPLVKGVTNHIQKTNPGVLVVGPDRVGAQLEGSKEFAKAFMISNNIPTAAYHSFDVNTYQQGVAFLKSLKPPYVLKADGLAAGKGVLIVDNLEEAINGLDQMLNKKSFGEASQKVVIEEFLEGIEVSVFVATDGKDWILLPEAKDYKRIGEGDTGPNTGGMGAVSPVPFADKVFMDKVKSRIVQPTIDGLTKQGIDYKGFIFIGLMNVQGEPYVIEYNVRLGDPETEAILPRIKSDFVSLLHGIAGKNLSKYTLDVSADYAVTVMLVSGGYPGEYKKGYEITGTEDVAESQVFFAGADSSEGKIITSGGRVIAVTTTHPTLQGARELSMQNAQNIQFQQKNYRKDIGLDVQN
jgi:phosphoribosylamine---glycine ligase